jgi:hypothetical protein
VLAGHDNAEVKSNQEEGIMMWRSPWVYCRAGELDDVRVDEGSAATVVTGQRDGELGVVAPAAGTVKESTEKISIVLLARRSWRLVASFSWAASLPSSCTWRQLRQVLSWRGKHRPWQPVAERRKEGARVFSKGDQEGRGAPIWSARG